MNLAQESSLKLFLSNSFHIISPIDIASILEDTKDSRDSKLQQNTFLVSDSNQR